MMDVKHLNVKLNVEDLKKEAYKIASNVKSDWKWDNVEFRIFTGGITNQLIGVYDKNEKDDIVLVRIYGESSELFIDREMELKTFKLLHSRGYAPKLYLTFENGMAFEYLPGIVVNSELCQNVNVYPLVARMMAKIHKINFNEEKECSTEPILWPLLEKFIDLIPETFSKAEVELRFRQCCPEGKNGLKKELSEMKKVLESVGNPVVFCHNDVILPNAIYMENQNRVAFIDYEYAGYNYQAYDLAIHFTSFADEGGFEDPQYPSEEYQLEWIREYFKELENCVVVNEEHVQKLYKHVCQFTPAANFLCAVCNFMQVEFSVIDFDFLKFAADKYEEYKKTVHYIHQ